MSPLADTNAAQPTAQAAPVVPAPSGAETIPPASENDIAVITEQLGRRPRGVAGVAARCVCGRPLVVWTESVLDDGSPFPTTFYLTQPALASALGSLEAAGVMREFNDRLAQEEGLAARYGAAHRDYLQRRALLGEDARIAGISAGGMPVRVKCLHALVAHSLAAGPGVNPIGDAALEQLESSGAWSRGRCSC